MDYKKFVSGLFITKPNSIKLGRTLKNEVDNHRAVTGLGNNDVSHKKRKRVHAI